MITPYNKGNVTQDSKIDYGEREEGYQFLRHGFTDKEAELIQKKIELSDYIKDNAVRNKPTDKYYWMTTDLKVITKYLDTIKELEQK